MHMHIRTPVEVHLCAYTVAAPHPVAQKLGMGNGCCMNMVCHADTMDVDPPEPAQSSAT